MIEFKNLSYSHKKGKGVDTFVSFTNPKSSKIVNQIEIILNSKT